MKMTIDERLEIIAQHLQTVTEMQVRHEETFTRLETNISRMEVGLNRLRKYALIIAADHESRIATLEDAAKDGE
jgi:hypothetical protein